MTERFEADALGDVADDGSTVVHGLVDDDASIEKRLAAGGRSFPDAEVDQPIKNAVLLSGTELVGIETPRENLAKPDHSPESTDNYHLSGTIFLCANVRE